MGRWISPLRKWSCYRKGLKWHPSQLARVSLSKAEPFPEQDNQQLHCPWHSQYCSLMKRLNQWILTHYVVLEQKADSITPYCSILPCSCLGNQELPRHQRSPQKMNNVTGDCMLHNWISIRQGLLLDACLRWGFQVGLEQESDRVI